MLNKKWLVKEGNRIVYGEEKFNVTQFFVYLVLGLTIGISLSYISNITGLQIYEEDVVTPAGSTAKAMEEKRFGPWAIIAILSVLVIEDFWFIFLPALIMAYLKFPRKLILISVSVIFALAHLLNTGFTFWGVIVFTAINIPHIKVFLKYGLGGSSLFHILYNFTLYSIYLTLMLFI